MGFLIVGLGLFAGAALFSEGGYTWLVALTGALAVVYGVCVIAWRSRRKFRSGFTELTKALDEAKGESDAP